MAPGIGVCVAWVWQQRWWWRKPRRCSVWNATLVTQGSKTVRFLLSVLKVWTDSGADEGFLYKHFGQGIGSSTSYICLGWMEGNVIYGLVRLFPVSCNFLYTSLTVQVPKADGTVMTWWMMKKRFFLILSFILIGETIHENMYTRTLYTLLYKYNFVRIKTKLCIKIVNCFILLLIYDL